MLGFGIRNSAKGIRNPANDWKLESKFHWQGIRNPGPGMQNPQRRIWNPGLSWITVHGPTNFIKKWASRLECRINNTSMILGHILLWRHIRCKKTSSDPRYLETSNLESLNVYNASSKSPKGSKKWFFKTVSESINQSFNDLKFCSPCSVPCAHNICIILGRYIHQKMLIHRTARYKTSIILTEATDEILWCKYLPNVDHPTGPGATLGDSLHISSLEHESWFGNFDRISLEENQTERFGNRKDCSRIPLMSS